MADEEDDDWFESAFRDDEDAPDDQQASDSDAADESVDDSEPDSPDAEDDELASDGEQESDFDASADSDDVGDSDTDTPPTGPAGESPDGPDAEEPPSFGDTDISAPDTGDGDVDDFAAAFGGGGGGGDFDGGGDDDDLFEDDFAAAFGGGGGGGGAGAAPGGEDDFGFDLDGDVGAGGSGGFEEDEEYESDIPRIDFGIEGLDEMVQGGVPERSLIVAIGGAGTGKTTFGLQFLHEAIRNGERAVYITLEESRQRVVQSATEKGWEFDRHTEEGNLAVIDIDPIEMANSLTSIRNELPTLIEEFGASRLVLDSVSLLEMMYDDQSVRRTEIYDFTKALKDAGVTTMLTSEANEDNAFASRHGIIEYLTDAVVVLRYIRPEDFRETRLAVEIQKIRDANHSRETKPYEITHQGISVYRQANIF
ncbi:KaiC domain-containing protein [Halobacterium noricense]|nr:KaiC domain-containing protein [Halobacterium sp. CBA1132]MCG1004029.1 KaiC domain-containing protein [Halobacterium noricense]